MWADCVDSGWCKSLLSYVFKGRLNDGSCLDLAKYWQECCTCTGSSFLWDLYKNALGPVVWKISASRWKRNGFNKLLLNVGAVLVFSLLYPASSSGVSVQRSSLTLSCRQWYSLLCWCRGAFWRFKFSHLINAADSMACDIFGFNHSLSIIVSVLRNVSLHNTILTIFHVQWYNDILHMWRMEIILS